MHPPQPPVKGLLQLDDLSLPVGKPGDGSLYRDK